METKTIILSEKEGKRYELHLFEDQKEHWTKAKEFWFKLQTIYSGETECLYDYSDKEEIAEKVVEKLSINKSTLEIFYKDYRFKSHCKFTALDSLLSAIGDYKYFILTETEI